MRFKCGPTEAEAEAEYRRLTNWHCWFAWRPVRVEAGDCRWLEWVERRAYFACGEVFWFYQKIPLDK